MAFPTSVNDQITDSISQSSVMNLGSSPAIATGNLLQATAHALALAAHNATFAHQQMQIIGQAVTTQGVALIYASTSSALRASNGADQHG